VTRSLGDRPAQWFVATTTLLCLVPFLDKAFHIDDPLFVWMARHIQARPLDPYGFVVNWYGFASPMVEVMRGPPLVPYCMAVVGWIAGWSEISLHAAFSLAAVAVALGTYRLARQLCNVPLTATLIATTTPVFLVSATTVMCDVVMLGFWTWAMAQWVDGVRTGERRRLVVAVALAAACVLTKYNGLTLLPLLLVYAVAYRGRLDRGDALLMVPLLVLAAWLVVMASLYGPREVQRSLSFASAATVPHGWSEIWTRLVITLAFAGGCFVAVLFYAPLLWPWRVLLVTLAAVLAAVWWIADFDGHAPLMLQGVDVSLPARATQLCLFVSAGLYLVLLAVMDLMRRRDAGAWLLILSVVGTLAFAGFIAWSVSGRYLLPIVPAAGILVGRRLEERESFVAGRRRWLTALPLVAAAGVALAVAWGDATLANTTRSAAAEIYGRYATSHPNLWFEGHWGFQYYMEEHGAKPIDIRAPLAAAGDVVVMPLNNSNLYEIPARFVQRSETLEWKPRSFTTTVSSAVGAGFYSDTFGPLPFAFGRAPAERYDIFTLGTPTAAP
jgi:hypothetical protein